MRPFIQRLEFTLAFLALVAGSGTQTGLWIMKYVAQ
jgi:hypothetical protein